MDDHPPLPPLPFFCFQIFDCETSSSFSDHHIIMWSYISGSNLPHVVGFFFFQTNNIQFFFSFFDQQRAETALLSLYVNEKENQRN
eukprot:m.137587 g.137587  ORF g.137587 m.137587 type:complete len:86 (+) comp15897_c1_seq1:2811-3068(+)